MQPSVGGSAVLENTAFLTRAQRGPWGPRLSHPLGPTGGDHSYRLDTVEQHGDRVVVAFSLSDRSGERHHWAQAFQLRDGRIVDMQDYESPTQAAALTGLKATMR